MNVLIAVLLGGVGVVLILAGVNGSGSQLFGALTTSSPPANKPVPRNGLPRPGAGGKKKS